MGCDFQNPAFPLTPGKKKQEKKTLPPDDFFLAQTGGKPQWHSLSRRTRVAFVYITNSRRWPSTANCILSFGSRGLRIGVRCKKTKDQLKRGGVPNLVVRDGLPHEVRFGGAFRGGCSGIRFGGVESRGRARRPRHPVRRPEKRETAHEWRGVL